MLGQHRALERVCRSSALSALDGLVSTETPPRCVPGARSAPEARAPELSIPQARDTRDRESAVSVRARLRWSRHAACRARLDLEWIDPSPAQANQCRMVCDGCPVRQPCRMFALRNGEPWGIWGGLDPDERAAVARTDGYPTPQALPAHGTNSRYAKHGCRCPACRHAHTTYEHARRARHHLSRS
jgi:hypothetical protein